MRFAIIVSAAPDPGLQPLRVARALLTAGHALPRVFFLREGVRHATPGTAAARAWAALAQETAGLELALCIGAATRRSLTEADTAPAFRHLGLGQYVELLGHAERVLDFPA
jgi:sulfur relay (sulfurtransferase) complex TusBCD TusD component (DsrE family)